MHAFPPAALTASPRAESACAVGTLAFHTQKHETCDRRCAATYCSAAPGSRMPNCWYAAMRRILGISPGASVRRITDPGGPLGR